jgi:hypothetical protein
MASRACREFPERKPFGKPESTQVVRHLNEPGTTWNDLVLDPESLVEFFSATPKPAAKRWTGYFVGIAGRRV